MEGLTARSHGIMVSLSKVCEASSCTTAGGAEEDTACALDCVKEHRNNASKQRGNQRKIIRSMFSMLGRKINH